MCQLAVFCNKYEISKVEEILARCTVATESKKKWGNNKKMPKLTIFFSNKYNFSNTIFEYNLHNFLVYQNEYQCSKLKKTLKLSKISS